MLDVVLTSDLHYGLHGRGSRTTQALAEAVCAEGGDVLILVGDIGRDPETLDACLRLFDGFAGLKLAVPGNHDVWLDGWESQTTSSWKLHEELLPKAFERHGFHPLHMDPVVHQGVAFVGTMGWYDYSFRDELDGITIEHYRTKTPPWADRPIWMDARKASFEHDDVALTELLTERLIRHLGQVQGPTVVASHHVVTKSLLVHPREIVPTHWRYANAFLGAECLARAIEEAGSVEHIACGHIHLERESMVGEIPAHCIGSDYKKKQAVRFRAGQNPAASLTDLQKTNYS